MPDPNADARAHAHARRDDQPEETRRALLSRTFDEDAELYDRARPGYPPELYDDLVDLAGARPGRRVLEIGCGTGQATVPLAALGCRITAVEAGPRMAAIARRNLAEAEAAEAEAEAGPGAGAGAVSAEVVTAEFENWPLPAEPFDVVLAATAFHWIDPAVRVTRAADALHPGGALAVVRNQHVRGGTEEFFVEVQRCYERFDPATRPGMRPPEAGEVDNSDHTEEIERSGRFGDTVFRRYTWDRTYSTAEYLDVLRTYSGHRALPDAARNGLLACVAGLIDGHYGGRVTKRYLIELAVSHRS
ncbi:class I SAM-dependent methyltransferase [Streptomyces sp. BPSDS2]|uniref:class I SAM-dependent methyltransferase n=1 Tax=Streptomyces sp. BPSDS2 TaxID=2571021 RepID=UPI0010C19200|nr:class I SAM-dependent methyltransferase [Streptomyces sp. BPSDS2]